MLNQRINSENTARALTNNSARQIKMTPSIGSDGLGCMFMLDSVVWSARRRLLVLFRFICRDKDSFSA